MNHQPQFPHLLRGIVGLFLIASIALAAVPAAAQSAPDGADVVRGFYAALLDAMKGAAVLGPRGRYTILAPAVGKAFDISLMTRLAVGPTWASLSAVQRLQASSAFTRYISAVYADRFDGYAGERLEVIGEITSGAGTSVRSRIVKSNGEPVSVSFLTRCNGDNWQVVDVYLDGSISELATRREEFAAILRNGGIAELIAALNRKADLVLTAAGTG